MKAIALAVVSVFLEVTAIVLVALSLAGCGGQPDPNAEKRQEYIDKCLIEAGPNADKNASDYCYAKWRQSQREK